MHKVNACDKYWLFRPILGIHSFADMYSCPELEYASRRYIYQHFLDVIRQDEFTLISEKKLIDLLQSDQLQVSSEVQVRVMTGMESKTYQKYLNVTTNNFQFFKNKFCHFFKRKCKYFAGIF